MTPEIDVTFDAIKAKYGTESLDRVEEMLEPRRRSEQRHPLQQAAKWILPGIPQVPWHDPYAYPEMRPLVAALEADHPRIKADHEASWSQKSDRYATYEHYLVEQVDWRALYLYRDGALNEAAADLAPTAYQVLSEHAVSTELICPLLESHFSTLLPRASIKPHCDLWNFSINLHLAVDIPVGAAICVAGRTRTWDEGKCLLFDYSFEHEAWNDSERTRTCLLMDLWHPDTTRPERQALTILMNEIQKMLVSL